MSSSLKERLKRCGRYHPATPTGSKTTSASRQNINTPSPNSISKTMHSIQQSVEKMPNLLSSIPVGSPLTKSTLPEPRRLLLDDAQANEKTSILSKPMKKTLSTSELCVLTSNKQVDEIKTTNSMILEKVVCFCKF